MKKILLRTCLCLCAALSLAGCSRQNKMQELLGQIPEDVDMVVVGDAKAVLESAGFKVNGQDVKLPSYLRDALGEGAMEDVDELRSLLKRSGIELEACALSMSYRDERPIVVFALSDADKFLKAIKGEGFRKTREDEGVKYYRKTVYESTYDPSYNDYGYIAVNGKYAYWIESVWAGSLFDAERTLGRMISEAKESPFSKTGYAKYITKGNAAGAAFRVPQGVRQDMRDKGFPSKLVEALDGVVCLKGDLCEGEAKVRLRLYDEDGSPRKYAGKGGLVDLGAKVNPDALSYLGKDEFLVAALSLKDVDLDECLDVVAEMAELTRSDRAALSAVSSYLGRLDGTMAIGVGLANGLSSVKKAKEGRGVMEEVPLTIVCETKEGKAKGLLSDLEGLLEAGGIDYDGTSSGLSVTIPTVGSIYAEAKDNVVVLSNRPISKKGENPAVKSVDFGKSMSTVAAVLGKGNPLAEDLGLDGGVELELSLDAEELELSLVLGMDGGKGAGIVEKVARACLRMASRPDELEELLGGGDYDYDYDFDDVALDTVAAEDDWD
ncbi:MAG: hypothetical protein LUC33_04325 [Prevotellaceae bacterium]|nr:hypothetical protein [Prevotellaceae bacterium]